MKAMRQGEEFCLPGLIISAVALPVMYFLAWRKLKVASVRGSRALPDSCRSKHHMRLAGSRGRGLVAQFFTETWWANPVVSLGVVWAPAPIRGTGMCLRH